jgi:hypothetical protein
MNSSRSRQTAAWTPPVVRETYAVAPPNECMSNLSQIFVALLLTVNPKVVLDRVKAFLPQLQHANAELQQRAAADPASVDIENVSEDTDQHIEMVR